VTGVLLDANLGNAVDFPVLKGDTVRVTAPLSSNPSPTGYGISVRPRATRRLR